ncbi:LysR family transcriptional regulator [Serinicoccus kebangsaanensis]|uniref:LysR family transcriptional regulator n=1 Tax=Serinicoccus kebangsaanensis TaxID=2602069 RepID=UPI00124F1EAB|nr:LysR family transcriptional regulator [Serinicoccus kebangsaanensis]
MSDADPSLRDLRSFVAVVDQGTFTDAAISLRTTQASVSRHVGSLEAALGVRLLQRGGRVVTLTVAGRRVLGHARRVLDEATAVVRAAQDEGREVRVGYAWAALGAHTATVQRAWSRRRPGSELTFVNSTTRFAGLTEGIAEVAVVRRDPGVSQIASALLGHEDRVAALPAGHELARRRSLRMADYAGQVVARDVATGTTTPDLWTPQQAPRAYREVRGTDEWLTTIAAGRAIGLTSQATAAQYSRQGVVFRRVRDAPTVAVHLIWWRQDAPVWLDDLCAIIREAYQAGSR